MDEKGGEEERSAHYVRYMTAPEDFNESIPSTTNV